MTYDHTITTTRLFMEPFAPAHTDALFQMNSDPQVMRYLGDPQSRADVTESIVKVQARWAAKGFSWWSIFLKDTDTLIGSACLQNVGHIEDAPLEIGWRLMTTYHGKGYATEAGQAAMNFAFERVGVDYVCAVANPANTASQNVMKRLGMHYVGVKTYYDEPCAYYERHKPT